MRFLCYLAAVLLGLQIFVKLISADEDCSIVEGITISVTEAVCSFESHSDVGTSFRNETRHYHGEYDEDDNIPYHHMAYYVPLPSIAECLTTCEGVSRENVTWCVRIADPSRYIETCVHLDENGELEFESTCDAQALELEQHISLPLDEECIVFFTGQESPGCLGLTYLNWFFKDAFLTCIVDTGKCTDVSFGSVLVNSPASNDQPPSFAKLTQSPLMVEPSDQLVIHAEVLSSHRNIYVSWSHENITYTDHVVEDPFCTPELDGKCSMDPHPDAEKKKMNRIISYSYLRTVSRDCLSQSVYKLVTYLVIESALPSDAGTYNVTLYHDNTLVEEGTVDVEINCDESHLYKANCSKRNVPLYEGDSYSWNCQLSAPHNTEFEVVLNQPQLLPPAKLVKQDNFNGRCVSKEPSASFFVVEEKVHPCHSKYTVQILVCSVKENMVGKYTIKEVEGNIMEGSSVTLKLNSKGEISHSSSDDESVSPAVYAVIPLVILICALLAIGIMIVILIRTRKRKRRRGHLSQLHSPDALASPDPVFYKKNGQFSPVSMLSPQSTCAAFSDPLEFPRNQLYVYTKKVLGEGSFGRVLQAKADGIVPGMPERNIVAIKTTKENATSVEIEELLAELDLMRNMKPHENILNLLGQCTTPGGPVCLIVEYARYGNLRDFLRQCEEVVLSLNHKPLIPRHRSRTGTFSTSSISSTQPLLTRQDSSVFTPGSAPRQFVFPFPSPPSHNMSTGSTSSTTESKTTAHHPRTAVPLAHSVAPIGHDYINSKGLVYMEDVQNFALQIACGLQHLASMEIVHCDLAARNILIAEGFVLKIADFGLARDISGREMYKKNPRGKIPVKWTAPEALENRIFTTKSDVWSFGVVLWELFTYGHSPYPDVHLGQSYEAIISYLKEGNRMEKPESCSDEFYEMMLKCWALDPAERPTPVDLVGFLTPLDTPHPIEELSILCEDEDK